MLVICLVWAKERSYLQEAAQPWVWGPFCGRQKGCCQRQGSQKQSETETTSSG